jgi:urease accessory protein
MKIKHYFSTIPELTEYQIKTKPLPSVWLMALIALASILPDPVWAHVESGAAGDGGFLSGVSHPIGGLDHVVAMIAVGLWGAILGAPAIWLLPVSFPLIMAIGAVLGIIDIPLPGVEVGIALSGIVLGSLVLLNRRLPLPFALLLIGLFAICHGHPHGAALPDFGVPILYAAGFVLSTGMLHLTGIGLGLMLRWPKGDLVVRGGGGMIALSGVYFLILALGMGGMH